MGTSTSVLEAISLRPLSPRVKSRIGIFCATKPTATRGKTTGNKMDFRMRDQTSILQVTHNSLLRAAPKAARER